MKNLAYWDKMRIYAYGFLIAIGVIPLFFGKNISQENNQLIVMLTVSALLAVAFVEWQRFKLKKK